MSDESSGASERDESRGSDCVSVSASAVIDVPGEVHMAIHFETGGSYNFYLRWQAAEVLARELDEATDLARMRENAS